MDSFVLGQNYDHFLDVLYETVLPLVDTDTVTAWSMKLFHQKYHVFTFIQNLDMYVSPILPDAMVSETPPSMDFWYSLPSAFGLDDAVLKTHVIVYAVVLEKDGEVPRIAIGSGCNSVSGAQNRTVTWAREYKDKLPMRVKEFMEKGYDITHMGVIVMIPMDGKDAIWSMLSGWIITLESAFTFLFWSIYQVAGKGIKDHYLGHICPFFDEDFEYLGLNTHSPMMEGVRDLELTPDELVYALNYRRNYHKIWRASEHGKALKKAHSAGYKLSAEQKEARRVNQKRRRRDKRLAKAAAAVEEIQDNVV